MSERPPVPLRDIDDIVGFVRDVLDRRLRTFGAHLNDDDREDAVSYLLETAYRLDKSYRSDLGLSFSTYCFRILRLRVVDWYRERLGDSRYGAPLELVSIEQLADELGLTPSDVVEANDESQLEEVEMRVALGL